MSATGVRGITRPTHPNAEYGFWPSKQQLQQAPMAVARLGRAGERPAVRSLRRSGALSEQRRVGRARVPIDDRVAAQACPSRWYRECRGREKDYCQ